MNTAFHGNGISKEQWEKLKFFLITQNLKTNGWYK